MFKDTVPCCWSGGEKVLQDATKSIPLRVFFALFQQSFGILKQNVNDVFINPVCPLKCYQHIISLQDFKVSALKCCRLVIFCTLKTLRTKTHA